FCQSLIQESPARETSGGKETFTGTQKKWLWRNVQKLEHFRFSHPLRFGSLQMRYRLDRYLHHHHR
ncbi:MAG: hypothetical protein LUO90_04255, partial [Methanoregula sp.]|nr:hypothetical protein [Methanoregula sp.]